MRTAIAIVVGAVTLWSACSKSANEGAEEARKQAEAEQKAKEASGQSAKKISPPVPGEARIPCEKLIDIAAFQTATGETEPLTIRDEAKNEPEAAASCSVVKGGKKLTDAEQQAKLKKEGRLGVIPGDVVCNVAAFCWTIEDPERFRKKCATRKEADDDTMGSYACKQTVMAGAFDVHVYRFFDADTKCILQVKGGASQMDNEITRKCAIAARDTIGPAQIAVTEGGAALAAPAAPAADGSGSAN
ncbi:MAG: hypothetical protein H0T46_05300 [Deltaproteobacteria bacterium]|nr:hypothetical protein [Deltaproteobacteria bacterium]